MTKKQLYIVIALLSALLLYVFFMPTQPKQETVVDVPVLQENEETVSATDLADEGAASQEVSQDSKEQVDETVVLKGIFVGLLDGENVYQKKYKYLLLNDGVEVLRIDLRPLIGYSDINVIEKLGVDRGDQIQVSGVMNDTEFVVKRID